MSKISTPVQKKKEELGEWKYVGDDGGRFIFERRSDKRIMTINKPRAIPEPKSQPAEINTVILIHGYRVNDEMIALCKK